MHNATLHPPQPRNWKCPAGRVEVWIQGGLPERVQGFVYDPSAAVFVSVPESIIYPESPLTAGEIGGVSLEVLVHLDFKNQLGDMQTERSVGDGRALLSYA